MSKLDGMKLENQLCFPLYAASREVIKRYRPFLDTLDLTYTQYIVMVVFWEKKTASVKELGRILHLDSGTLTPVLKSLEAKGFVQRSRSAEDERVLIVTVTPEGESLQEKAKDVPAHIRRSIKLTDAEAVRLHALLYKLLGDT